MEVENTTGTSACIGELPIERLRAMCLFLIGQIKMNDQKKKNGTGFGDNEETANPFCSKIWQKFAKRQQSTFPGQNCTEIVSDKRIFTPNEMVLIFRHQILPNLCEILTRGGGQIDYRSLLLLQSKLSAYKSSNQQQTTTKNDEKQSSDEKEKEKSNDSQIDAQPESPSSSSSTENRRESAVHPKIRRLNEKVDEMQSKWYANLVEERRQIQKAAEVSDRAFFQLTLEAKKKNVMLKHLALCRKAELALKKCRQLGRLGNNEINKRAENPQAIANSSQISNEKSTNTYESTDFPSLHLAKRKTIYDLQARAAELKNELRQSENEVSEDQEIFYDINRD